MISLIGYQHYQANNYRLESSPDEDVYYIVSPKDIILARPRSVEDHIDWLVNRQRYEEALIIAENIDQARGSDKFQVHKIVEIGQKFLSNLMMESMYVILYAKMKARVYIWIDFLNFFFLFYIYFFISTQ